MKALLRRIDHYQQRHAWLGFPLAVFKKFGDDDAGQKAALVAYYGFFSLFPLLLVFATVLGFVLSGNPTLQHKILSSTLARFPVIGAQIQENIHSLQGSGITLAIGIVGTLWAGLGVTAAFAEAMNTVWNVPRKDRPNFLTRILRGLLSLLLLGIASLAATFLAGFGTSGSHNIALTLGGIAASFVVNFGLFLVGFRVLTTADLTWRDVVPGALIATVFWSALQSLGGWYVGHQLKNASEVYGTLAIVIGLLSWLYLGAQLTLYAAEINCVRLRRLWPRALVRPPLTSKDKQILVALAKMEERLPEESIDVTFNDSEERPKKRTAQRG
jgi:YihY family inner membrane protein